MNRCKCNNINNNPQLDSILDGLGRELGSGVLAYQTQGIQNDVKVLWSIYTYVGARSIFACRQKCTGFRNDPAIHDS